MRGEEGKRGGVEGFGFFFEGGEGDFGGFFRVCLCLLGILGIGFRFEKGGGWRVKGGGIFGRGG